MSTDTQEKAALHGSLASDAFRLRYKELLASFDPSQVGRALVAFIRLNLRDVVARTEPDLNAYLGFTEEAFLALYDGGKLQPVERITPLGEAALTSMRQRTGIGYVAQPSTPKPPTADELLEQEVRNDFATLPGDKMREKRRTNRRYEAAFQRIAYTLGGYPTIA